ncbi:hypothetical protein CISIN_1g037021mg [Citrus sinensis]|uniref:Kinesin motor domain-containing protein n=1 Tax=Citrus sinensis TaxID=2711 RepID=A0A067GT84_CITSI|nr:hypothetical protein CISIN_1g037021mg [Citrus sinensis]
MDLPRRSHKDLIVNVSHVSDVLPPGKMNFVDLTCSIFVENTEVNKSIYTLFNVVYALNANESHVPYWESKLTRMLQESVGCKSKILMLTCLKTKSSASSMLLSFHKNQSPKSVSTTKTQTESQMHFSTKKATGVASMIK